MDAAAQIGLGHGDRVRQVDLALHLGGQDGGLRGAPQNRPLGIAQDADAGGGLVQRGLGRIAAVRGARIVVVAGAQEDEGVVVERAQELQVLGHDLRVDAAGAGFQMGDRARHQFVHGRVVGDGRVHVGQGLFDAGLERLAAFGRQGIDDKDDQGFTGVGGSLARAVGLSGQIQDRVEQSADRNAGVRQFAHDAVDQEGPVVLDDAKDVIGGRAAPGGGQRLDQDPGFARRPAFSPAPGVGQNGADVFSRQLRRLVLGVVFPGLDDEGLLQPVEGPSASQSLREGPLQRLRAGGLGGGAEVAGHGQGLERRGRAARIWTGRYRSTVTAVSPRRRVPSLMAG